MSDYTTGSGVYKGWYWRYIGIAVLGVVLLQILSFYTIHWPVMESTQIAMFIVLWFIISRVRERRLLNGLLGTVLVFVIGLVLQYTVGIAQTKAMTTLAFWQSNLMILVVSVLLAWLYTKMQLWSERKREQMEAKRRDKVSATRQEHPQVRVHRKKKKKR